eukprot:m.39758 g.39758  ORF g.39758 m.39758 type:complete len:71 (-) comp8000_c0_seq2:777-989(-)
MFGNFNSPPLAQEKRQTLTKQHYAIQTSSFAKTTTRSKVGFDDIGSVRDILCQITTTQGIAFSTTVILIH